MTFVNKLIKSGIIPIHFITCKDPHGRDCYYFILATHEKMKLLANIKNGVFNIKDYGKIIASGFGNVPSDVVKQKLLEEYNFDYGSL